MHRATSIVASTITLLFAALAVTALLAADAKPPAAAKGEKPTTRPQAYLTPDAAGPAYLIQGEYVTAEANSGKSKLAAQVVALGDGDYLAAFYPGGLPGDGHTGKGRVEAAGKAADPAGGEVSFGKSGAKGYSAVVNSPNMRVTTPEGDTIVLKQTTRTSPTAGAKPPEGAIVLFDGMNTDQWKDGKMDDRKLLMPGAETKKQFQDFTLHLEFIEPFKPLGRDQDRGNSGVYIQKRYELQILDTFGHEPEFNGNGAIYRQRAPMVNMCYPPLKWQTYDIDFTAPKFDDGGKKTKNAVITVKHNGVPIHQDYEITDKTGAGQKEGPAPGPILLQNHGNPVFFRNIWIVEKLK